MSQTNYPVDEMMITEIRQRFCIVAFDQKQKQKQKKNGDDDANEEKKIIIRVIHATSHEIVAGAVGSRTELRGGQKRKKKKKL